MSPALPADVTPARFELWRCFADVFLDTELPDTYYPQAANLILRWPSVTGRVYSIWRATNVAGPFTQHIGNIAANAPTNTVTNATPGGLGTFFYGIGVQRAP